MRGDRDKIGGYEETFNSVTRRTKILFERNQKVIPVGSIVRAEWAFEDDFHGPMYDCDWAAGGGTAGSGSQNNCELTGFTIDCEDETITPDGSIRILHAFEDGDPLLMLMNEGAGIGFGTVTGGVIGTTAAEKFAFWGATPAVQDTGWSVTNYTAATKTLDGSTATLADVINFLGTLSEELLKTRLGLKGS